MKINKFAVVAATALTAILVTGCSGTSDNTPSGTPVSAERGRTVFADLCLNSGLRFENIEARAVAKGMTDMSYIGEPGEVFYVHNTQDIYLLVNPRKTSCAMSYTLPNAGSDNVSAADFDTVNPNGFDISHSEPEGTTGAAAANVLIAANY